MNRATMIFASRIFLLTWLLSFALFAGKPLNVSFFGVAVDGYDVVAYFTQSKAVEGKKAFSYSWSGGTWYFSSAENRDLFKAAPEKYAPQYGGFCAWAVSEKSEKFNIDPLAWKIVDGKLYLNYDQDIKKKWETNIPLFIQKADQNWPKIKND